MPVFGGLLATLSYTDTMLTALFLVGYPAAVVAAGLATWSTFSGGMKVARAVGALVVAAGFGLFVVPIRFFVSFVLFILLIGDDSTGYF